MYYSRSFILNGTNQHYDTVETSTFSGIKTPGNYVHGDISSLLVIHAYSRLFVEVFGIHKFLAIVL
jgi:hypothetical protein